MATRNDIPASGWMYIDVQDLESACGTCDLCGARIRFNHVFQHPDYEGLLGIGCECAAKIINGTDLLEVKAKDKRMKKKAASESRHMETLRRRYREKYAYRTKHGLPCESEEEYINTCLAIEERRKTKNG